MAHAAWSHRPALNWHGADPPLPPAPGTAAIPSEHRVYPQRRASAAQLRLHPQRLNPATIMPAYHRTDGLTRVARQWQDQTLFSAQQLEDVVAFLETLK